ncbi:MAG: DUF1203 domain-containing protein [Jatrophihabitantaceae bacterium]
MPNDTITSPTIVIEPLPPDLPMTGWRTFTDSDGGAPLRCCLRQSRVGERITLASVAPPGPAGAYLETGPVFVHAEGCTGPATDGYPAEFRTRPQVFRAYGADGTIVGGELVEPGEGQEAVAARLLADPAVAFLHSRNVVHGCYMFAIRRAAG